jgi:RNA polymerase sigma factor (TIGR02999 family)
MTTPSVRTITQLLQDWRQGDRQAVDQLMPLVYDELRRLAEHCMRDERPDHTWQPTALVHEAYLKLIDMDVPWSDRVHFFAVASRLMRRLLVDYAKAHRAAKRGGEGVKVSLAEAAALVPERDADVIALDEALTRLAVLDPQQGQIVELHYFGGLTYEETAHVLGISDVTVFRELKMAKAWLYNQLRNAE